ncbi:TPA: ornithine carbamoyltransferase [Candidatus Woesearchaeota archaeon]|nr:Ornithine carbamoyltransferase, catabolic [archaeon GW2011_AR15]MBS3104099.1 ornithine carbamoyltransferase [Candidatus Woesearchaeota archaeon]HIH41690.1 ornithine carbamoyltransferase [Candidatus Woesearchaeota archaeon]
MKKDFLKMTDLTSQELKEVIELAVRIKKNPEKYSKSLSGKTLLMIFAKPSLRTRVSFETGMTKLGGHAIYYDIATSPLGRGETIADTAKCSSRYVDIISARLFEHADIVELAKNSDAPVINMLTNLTHPCQGLADLMTIKEKKGKLEGLKLAYLGDGNNNVTHSLLLGCALSGINISVASPEGMMPDASIVAEAKKLGKVVITHNAGEAAKDADVIVTDTWMSYHIRPEKKEERVKKFRPYQVNSKIMKLAKKDAIFMHCLPAYRDYEVTAEVIDGPQSVVFDEAENRMWTEMALMVALLK